jgi:hypothetical protein
VRADLAEYVSKVSKVSNVAESRDPSSADSNVAVDSTDGDV